ncbi:MAG: hypothetical protein GY817_00920 [bacterium]|nr:hypothetical protein [bacterium]
MRKLKVAFLWHEHQPYYKNDLTAEYTLPWVRLYAVKDYYDTAVILDKYPKIKLNFNIVPALLKQLDDYANYPFSDKFFDLSMKPAKTLIESDKLFIRNNFFHVI